MRNPSFTACALVALAGCGGATMSVQTETGDEVQARVLDFGFVDGALEVCDPRLPDRRFVDRYALDVPAGTRVRVHLHSTVIDPVLEIEGPGGLEVDNDDGFAGSLDSFVAFTARQDGPHLVRVTSVSEGEAGAYRLRVERADAASGVALTVGAARTDHALVPPRAGELPGAWFRFEAEGGAWVRLRVTSTDFDTVATVIGPSGQTWVNDDANELGADGTERPLDSTLLVAAPETGSYQLVVTAYGEGAGRFRVASSVRSPVVLAAGEEVAASGWAGADAQGRMVGLFAGITAYSQQSPLYGCADDARFLAQAFRERHLMAQGAQRVLLDGQATRAAFLDGLRWLATEARPADVVVVFYSGHGNVQAAPEGDTTEIDRLDETLVLIDGPVIDTEVAAALDAVPASRIVLALDSCHSGGFADDFARKPGRIGLFSSDSDVLSDTAEPRRAGGYLSYWLREAVLGNADARPTDGFLTAGELTDYLYEGFVEDHRRMNREGSRDPVQRLVAERGSIPWTETLWVYPRAPDRSLPAVPDVALDSADPGPGPAAGAPVVQTCGTP